MIPEINIKPNLINTTAAICSGILTNLIADSFTCSSFTLKSLTNSKFIISENHAKASDLLLNCLLVLIIFFLLWIILNMFFYLCMKIFNNIGYKKWKNVSGYSLTKQFTELRTKTFFIADSLFTSQSRKENPEYSALMIREVATITLALYNLFIPPNRKMRSFVLREFRNPKFSPSIASISSSISCYELLALITLLTKITLSISANSNSDVLLSKDCQEILDLLNLIKSSFFPNK